MDKSSMNLTVQLDRTVKLSGARWALWIGITDRDWDILFCCGLSRTRHKELEEILQSTPIKTWMAGSMSSGRVRTRQLGRSATTLGCDRIFFFPNASAQAAILVGGDHLTSECQEFFKILALSDPFEKPDGSETGPDLHLIYPMDTSLGASYSPDKIFDWILDVMSKSLPIDAAYLAIHSGEIFQIQALWNYDPSILEQQISIYASRELRLIQAKLHGMITKTTNHLPEFFNPGALSFAASSFLSSPILIGQRLIGLMVCASSAVPGLSNKDRERADWILERVAHAVEMAIVFNDLSRYLKQSILVSELAAAATAAADLTQIPRRIKERLARTFHSDQVAVFLVSQDGKSLSEFSSKVGSASLTIPVSDSLLGYVVETGLPYRTGDVHAAPRFFPEKGDYRSLMAAPLKYGGRIIGVIGIGDLKKRAFTIQDEQLLVAVASQLAGIIENVHHYEKMQLTITQLELLRETALDISNLELGELIKRIVNRARQLVNAPGAELGLLDSENNYVRVLTSDNPWYKLAEGIRPLGIGVTGRIAQSGTPMAVADYNTWDGRLFPDQPHPCSAIAGVPLKIKGEVIGTLIVMDDAPGRIFTEEDIHLLELLAPQVALSIRNARLYQELHESQKRDELSQKALLQAERLAAAGRLTASIAHEINNPLQALHNCLDLAARTGLKQDQRQKYLGLAISELNRLMGTVERMLAFYRPIARDREWVNLNDVLHQAVDLLQPQFEESGIKIHLQLDPQPLHIMAVATQIQQVLFNLLINAMEAMPNGGEIWVASRKTPDPEGRSVEMTIADNGPGIHGEQLERLFEPLISSKPNGTGLGLAVSYGIVEAHGGSIKLLSGSNRGACFQISLPEE